MMTRTCFSHWYAINSAVVSAIRGVMIRSMLNTCNGVNLLTTCKTHQQLDKVYKFITLSYQGPTTTRTTRNFTILIPRQLWWANFSYVRNNQPLTATGDHLHGSHRFITIHCYLWSSSPFTSIHYNPLLPVIIFTVHIDSLQSTATGDHLHRSHRFITIHCYRWSSSPFT